VREARAGVPGRQHPRELLGVLLLQGGHGLVHQAADGRLARVVLEGVPAGLARHPEYALGDVLVAVLGGFLAFFSLELVVQGGEGVADVLQEHQAEHDVLVLGGVHVTA